MRRLFPLAVLLVLGCAPPPTPQELVAKTSTDVQDFWKQALATARITNTMRVRDEFFTNIEGLQKSTPSSRPTIPEATGSEDTFADVSIITTRVFTDANVTVRGGSQLTFRLTGKDLCTPLHGFLAPDSKCVANVDNLKMAVRADAGSNGVTVTWLLNDTIELGSVEILTGTAVAVKVDLGNAQKASEFVNATLGQDSPFTRLTFVGAGKVEARLRKWGPSDFEASLSILSDVSGTVTDENGFSRSGKSPARSPLIAGRIDGIQKVLTATVDVGSSEFRGLWSDFFDSKLKTPMTWALAGLTLKAMLKDGGDRTVTGISFGDAASTLKYAETTVASVDLNPLDKRRFDLAITTGSGGLDAFTVRPAILGTLALTLQTVANAGSNIDSALLNSTYEYDFTASDKTPQFELIRPTQNINAGWKITDGNFSLSSPSFSPAQTFTAPNCMTFRSGGPLMPNQSPLLELFTPQPCP